MRARSLISVLILSAACGGNVPPAQTQPTIVMPAASISASPPKSPQAKPKTIKRIVSSLGRVAGTDVSTVASDGTITVAVDVVENGRGPHVDARIRLAPDGTIAHLQARGNHTMGNKVAEYFKVENGTASWHSNEEKGSVPASSKPAFYVPIAALPDALGLLAQAAIKNGGKITILPEGEVAIERTGDATIKSKSGEERHIVSYAMTGLDLVPVHIWMNDDGSWFGKVSAWDAIVPDGFEGMTDDLVQKQEALNRAREAKIATALSHKPPAAGIAFTHARVLDVVAGKYKDDQTLIVVGDKIKAVGGGLKPPAGAEVIDVAKKTIVPGLWDMHAHLNDPDGLLDIASGVTTARDVGNDPDKLDAWKKSFDDGTTIGPHVLRHGFIEGRNEKAAGSKVTAETPEEAKAAVEFFAKRGYEGIKIYNSVKPELVPILTKEAHAKKMLVTGHVPVHMLAHEAVKAGYDQIEHVNMLFLNFFADHDTDTRTTKRFTLVGDNAAGFDLKSKPATDFFTLLKEKKTVIDPTLSAFQDLLLAEPGKVIPGLEGMLSRLPPQNRRDFLVGGLPMDGEKVQLYKRSFEKLLAMVKTLHEQKIPVVIGTDALAGLSLHHELKLFVQAGLTPAETLRCATIEAAKAMKQDTKSGSIAEGKTADFFIVDGDPLTKIEDASRVVTTVRAGTTFESKKLYEAVSVKPL